MMWINALNANSVINDVDGNKKVLNVKGVDGLRTQEQSDNQSIAVKMEISKKGRELLIEDKMDVLKSVEKSDGENIAAKMEQSGLDCVLAGKGSISEEGEAVLEEIEEKKEKDYSKFVVQKNMIEEMQDDALDAVVETEQKQNDVEIMIRSLGEDSGWSYEKKEDSSSNENSGQIIRDGSLYEDLTSPEAAVDFAKRQSRHVVNEAFEADQMIQDEISLSEKRIESHKENILDYQKEISRIGDENKENIKKEILSEEEYSLYKTGRDKELSGIRELIAEEKDGMYEEIRTINAINKANIGNQNMLLANREAQQLMMAANDEFLRRTMHDIVQNKKDEYELEYDRDRKHEEESEDEELE